MRFDMSKSKHIKVTKPVVKTGKPVQNDPGDGCIPIN